MSIAQENFLTRLNHLRLAFSNNTLVDKPPSNIEHNNVAKILRNGMAVVGFVTLEDFIKSRTGEILNLVSNSGRNFTDLPLKLQFATTNNLIKAFPNLLKFQETKADKISLILDQASSLASTSNTPFNLSEYTFGYSKSNISKQDIVEILKSFNIHDCWNQMSQISSRLGLTGQNLEISFSNATTRRHSAAHNINANTPINDLTQFLTEAVGFAIAFDSLLIKAYKFIFNNENNYLDGTTVVSNNDVNLSTIKLEGNKWKFKREINSMATRSSTTRQQIIDFGQNFSSNNDETLVIFNSHGVIEKWISN